ncbi:MAG TPA: hypothetical protein VHH36_08320 [Candidatus Thermoplasmatota archaeon]|nr:hypothetical protein [Candidatus Thermoplasmatota archaeon]
MRASVLLLAALLPLTVLPGGAHAQPASPTPDEGLGCPICAECPSNPSQCQYSIGDLSFNFDHSWLPAADLTLHVVFAANNTGDRTLTGHWKVAHTNTSFSVPAHSNITPSVDLSLSAGVTSVNWVVTVDGVGVLRGILNLSSLASPAAASAAEASTGGALTPALFGAGGVLVGAALTHAFHRSRRP